MNKQKPEIRLLYRYCNEQGMTLIELTVVLLILTTLATVALRSTTNLVEQARWEQTKKRYEEIKKAIIGDPDVVINNHPDISGFVADMGRLPANLHELLGQEYCDNDYTIVSVPGTADQTACTTGAGNWIVQTGYTAPTASQIGYGWHGPYLMISESSNDEDAFTDGWGNIASSANDPNYGWNYAITAAADVTLQSYGKDRVAGGVNYDADYPASATAIVKDDWRLDISSGIDAEIHAANIPGSCDVSAIADGKACVDAGWNWLAGGGYKCFKTVAPFDQDTAITDYATCSGTPNRIWRWSPNPACSDPSKTTKASCTAAAGTWSGCNAAVFSPKAFCMDHGGSWNYDSQQICMRINYRSINASTGATEITNIASSGSLSINSDGNLKSLHFTGFNNTLGGLNQLPAGSTAFTINHFIGSCQSLPYPATICTGAAVTAANCTAGTPPVGIWNAVNSSCYVANDALCTATLGGTVKHSAVSIAPVIKPVIPRKPVPRIVW